MDGNSVYFDQSYARFSHISNITWTSIYLCPRKVMLDNEYDFNRYFANFIKDVGIKPI